LMNFAAIIKTDKRHTGWRVERSSRLLSSAINVQTSLLLHVGHCKKATFKFCTLWHWRGNLTSVILKQNII